MQIFNESEKEKVEKLIMKPLSITKPFGIKKSHLYFIFFFGTNGPILMKLAQKLLNYDIKMYAKNQVSILNGK